MKKQDLIPIVIIFALFLAYPTLDRKFISKIFPPKEKPAPAAVEEPAATDVPADTELAAAPTPAAAASAPTEPVAPASEAAPAPDESLDTPEVRSILKNDKLELTLSSHGAGVVEARLLAYPLYDGSEERVAFDFSDKPAAAAIGYPGLAPDAGFEVVQADELAVIYRYSLPNGLVLTRTLTLDEGYQVRIEDQIQNTTANAVALDSAGLQSGFMVNLPDETDNRTPLLGIDTLTGSEKVKYWAKKFPKWFPSQSQTIQTQSIPGPGEGAIPVDWVAVKNKYFTQILTPETAAGACTVEAAYGEPVNSTFLGIFPRSSTPLEKVAINLTLPELLLPAGETVSQTASWYMGPKVLSLLKANGPHQEDILQLGFWRPIGMLILKILIWVHGHIWPYSYGLAIILLTVLIRVVFWPLNHKAMVSTRHMQEVQPLITALREKYKDNPQRQQQEMMALYKEHKINPMGGCLPMLVQIPVFFALFVVLRGAIELRFSSFLWISDLSTPENLFKDVLPVPLNILPLFMGLTMWIQQRMTPASGDPQQRKMMMMMPVLFTFMFYSFPSGLSLYWSVNQIMMIVQLAWMKKVHPPLQAKVAP